jgi:hypothetical protein
MVAQSIASTQPRPIHAFLAAAVCSAVLGCASVGSGNGPAVLVGTWQLVSRVDSTADGRQMVEPTLGSDPIALLIYDRAGNVAAQLMRRDRAASSVATPTADPNNSGAINGYDAYFGTYAVNYTAGEVTHTLTAALVPTDVGRQLVRRFRINNNDLVISFDARSASGGPVTRILTWHRAD